VIAVRSSFYHCKMSRTFYFKVCIIWFCNALTCIGVRITALFIVRVAGLRVCALINISYILGPFVTTSIPTALTEDQNKCFTHDFSVCTLHVYLFGLTIQYFSMCVYWCMGEMRTNLLSSLPLYTLSVLHCNNAIL